MKNRWIYEEIKNCEDNMIIHLSGQRRTGKTTLFMQLSNNIKDSEYILITPGQKIKNIANHINNSNKSIFFIDEVTSASDIENLNILYDECIRIYNKKIYITSTNSLEIYLIRSSILAGRVKTIPIYPMSINEYTDIILNNKRYDREDYTNYLKTGGLFNEYDGKEQIDFIVESLSNSINRCLSKKFKYEELKITIISLLVKMVWDNIDIMNQINPLVDSKSLNKLQIDIIKDSFDIKSTDNFIEYPIYKLVVDLLQEMNVIKYIYDIDGYNGKLILMNNTIQIYLYVLIIEKLSTLGYKTEQFNITFWGKLFENIMIMANIGNKHYSQYTYKAKTPGRAGEIDDILVDENNIYLIEYKSNINFQTNYRQNYIFNNNEELEYIKKMIGVNNINFLYVYPGNTDKAKDLYNNIEFLNSVRDGKLNLLIKTDENNLNKSNNLNNLNKFRWGD